MFSAGDHVPVYPLLEVVGRALKLPPVHIALTAVNVGVIFGLTVIVMAELVAGEPIWHILFAVITAVTTSLFAKALLE